jgi:tRNA A-37 threonylcarbamoyl transferase component Bud32
MFRGTERFELVRRIGEGGMGVVYEAYDRDQRTRIALKTLRLTGRDSLLRFKNEFRSLQGVYHPNLVGLGELCERDGDWFYTMQYVDGVDFVSHVERRDSSTTARLELGAPAPAPLKFDERKLRAALVQLAAALAALHGAGKVHRDIKPGNILVTPDGKLYLLDFGLVTDAVRSTALTGVDRLIGTPAYMSPEQARGDLQIGPRSDCYSVGVLLYRALTGMLLARGSASDLVRSRRTQAAMRPSLAAPGVPADLDELCFELLAYEPADRPSAADVGHRLRGTYRPRREPRSELIASPPPGPARFVGRAGELARLREAFAACAPGSPVVAFITGESGVGKTALLGRFVGELAAARAAAVLSGRCYAREAVPFKGFDGVIDSLGDFLARLSPDEIAPLLPANIALLSATFPVLERVEAIAAAPDVSAGSIDPQLVRPVMVATLRELLTRIARQRRVVIAIDDFQWTDPDSIALLADLVRAPDAPGVLVVATLRSDAAAWSQLARWPLPELARHVELAGLPAGDARALAAQLAGDYADGPVGGGALDPAAIADAAEGHPLFIDELMRHAMAAGATRRGVGLHEALRARIARLPARPREILDALAVAVSPLEIGVLARVIACNDLAELHGELAALRAANLIRMSGVRTTDAVELYHDQIGVALRAQLAAAAVRELHRRLAIGLEAEGPHDPDRLTLHWLAADVPPRAIACALQATDEALQSLAFDRAAALLRLVLQLVPDGDPRRRGWQIRLAEATSFLGRGKAAAEIYCSIAAGAGDGEAMELYRRAAELLLMQGHTDAGLAVLRRALAIAGLPIPSSTPGVLLGFAVARARVRLRGKPAPPRAAGPIAPEVLCRIDLCFAACVGLAPTHPLLGALFQARHTVLAFDAGEPSRAALALFAEAAYACVFGLADGARVRALLAEAHRLAGASGVDRVLAIGAAASALIAAASGRWASALALLEEGEHILVTRCRGATWELGHARVYFALILAMAGEVERLLAVNAGWLRHADDRHDVGTATHLRIGVGGMVELFADRPARLRDYLRAVRERIRSDDANVTTFMALFSDMQLALYSGSADEACERFDACEPRFARSFLLHGPTFRILFWDLRARVALGAAAARPGSPGAEAVARRAVRQLASERDDWARPLARSIEAGLAALHDDTPRAIALYRDAAHGFAASSMKLHQAFAQRRAAAQAGDAAEAARIDRELTARGIRRVDRLAQVYVPIAEP